ncbi:unnamed protein product, partial [marine sediment metagenome]
NVYRYDYTLPDNSDNWGQWTATVQATDGIYTTTGTIHFVLEWWDNDYDYRTYLHLTENFSVDHTNEELGFVLSVDNSKLVEGGAIRVVNDRGENLPFRVWYEEMAGGTITVYVNFLENISADNVDTVYVYYDNDTSITSYPNYATDMGRTLVEDNYTQWYDTNAGDNITYGKAVKVADVDDDGDNEIIVVGRSHAGTGYNRGFIRIYDVTFSSPAVATLSLLDDITWLTDNHTFVYSLDIWDVDDDGTLEIVTGGVAYDGTQNRAELNVWSYSGGTINNEDNLTWYYENTAIYGVKIYDVDEDGAEEILVVGTCNNSENGMFRIYNYIGSSLTLENAVENIYLSSGTTCELYGVAAGDLYGDGSPSEIAIVGIAENADGTLSALIKIYHWDDTTLSDNATENWNNGYITELFSVDIGQADNDDDLELVVSGNEYDGAVDCALFRVYNATGAGHSLVHEGGLSWVDSGHSSALSVIVGDIDLDNIPEITTVGFQNDG